MVVSITGSNMTGKEVGDIYTKLGQLFSHPLSVLVNTSFVYNQMILRTKVF